MSLQDISSYMSQDLARNQVGKRSVNIYMNKSFDQNIAQTNYSSNILG
jgi:hypothetical protein